MNLFQSVVLLDGAGCSCAETAATTTVVHLSKLKHDPYVCFDGDGGITINQEVLTRF